MPNKTLSDFARALRALLTESELFTRSEWARVLNVSEPAISQWVNDKTVPRPDILHMLVDIVSDTNGKGSVEALKRFWAVADTPSEEVSPLGVRMAPTVNEYMKSATIAGLAKSLREEVAREAAHPSMKDGEDALTARGTSKTRVRVSSPSESFLEIIHESKPPSDLDINGLPDVCPTTELGLSRLNWEELLSKKSVILVGGAGSGKTSILGAMYRRFSNGSGPKPLWLGSAVWSDEKAGNYVAKNVVELSRQASSPVFIDGLDECPRSFRSGLIKDLLGLHEAVDHPVIVASRPVNELAELDGFERYNVASMTGLQSYSFLSDAMKKTGSHDYLSQGQFHKFICHFAEKERDVASMLSPVFLKSVWRLFVQHSQTPFWETDGVEWVVRAIFNDLDREKNLCRFREEWASEKAILSILGNVSFRLLQSGASSFDQNLLSDCLGNRRTRPLTNDVSELLESQGWVCRKGDQFEVSHAYFRDYFAARHIVESSEAVSAYYSKLGSKPAFRNVLRIAAGLASDASDILDLICDHPNMGELQKASFLTEVMSQPVFADDKSLDRSSDLVVKTFDKCFEGWELNDESTENETNVVGKPWHLNASKHIPVEHGDLIAPAISALHRSRSGNTGAIFQEKLASASTAVLNRVGTAMSCEGKMRADVAYSSNGSTLLRAAVGSPHLH